MSQRVKKTTVESDVEPGSSGLEAACPVPPLPSSRRRAVCLALQRAPRAAVTGYSSRFPHCALLTVLARPPESLSFQWSVISLRIRVGTDGPEVADTVYRSLTFFTIEGGRKKQINVLTRQLILAKKEIQVH